MGKTHNVTVSLSPEVIRKVRALAAKRSTSISELVAERIEELIRKDEAYEKAKRSAVARMRRGIHLGGVISASRDELHER
jgi:predicted transcriptional regulator